LGVNLEEAVAVLVVLPHDIAPAEPVDGESRAQLLSAAAWVGGELGLRLGPSGPKPRARTWPIRFSSRSSVQTTTKDPAQPGRARAVISDRALVHEGPEMRRQSGATSIAELIRCDPPCCSSEDVGELTRGSELDSTRARLAR
jgi:hypothetical protein